MGHQRMAMPKPLVESEFVKTGNFAVDMVAACVSHYRKYFKPIKTIWLRKDMYNKFEYWALKNIGEENLVRGKYCFDSVDIERGSDFQVEPIYVDFYPLKQADA